MRESGNDLLTVWLSHWRIEKESLFSYVNGPFRKRLLRIIERAVINWSSRTISSHSANKRLTRVTHLMRLFSIWWKSSDRITWMFNSYWAPQPFNEHLKKDSMRRTNYLFNWESPANELRLRRAALMTVRYWAAFGGSFILLSIIGSTSPPESLWEAIPDCQFIRKIRQAISIRYASTRMIINFIKKHLYEAYWGQCTPWGGAIVRAPTNRHYLGSLFARITYKRRSLLTCAREMYCPVSPGGHCQPMEA